ncbi:MAG TPA: addiction module toxin RelE [Acidobacteria bacterium]|nr:addiction module toxin RelE [Acidobacteriota bacterium]
MRLVLRHAAKLDLAEARRWYEERQPRLGQEFIASVDAALALIREFPLIAPKVDPRVRRAGTKRFPYGIFYIIDGQTIRVLAVLRNGRSSFWWQGRMKED